MSARRRYAGNAVAETQSLEPLLLAASAVLATGALVLLLSWGLLVIGLALAGATAGGLLVGTLLVLHSGRHAARLGAVAVLCGLSVPPLVEHLFHWATTW